MEEITTPHLQGDNSLKWKTLQEKLSLYNFSLVWYQSRSNRPLFRTAVHTLYGTCLPEITIRKTFDTGSNRAHLSSSRPIPSALIPLVGNNGEFTTYTYLHIGKILSTLSLSPHGFALGHLPKGLSPMKTTHVYINPCPTSCLSDVGLCLHPNSSSMLWFSESYFQS